MAKTGMAIFVSMIVVTSCAALPRYFLTTFEAANGASESDSDMHDYCD